MISTRTARFAMKIAFLCSESRSRQRPLHYGVDHYRAQAEL